MGNGDVPALLVQRDLGDVFAFMPLMSMIGIMEPPMIGVMELAGRAQDSVSRYAQYLTQNGSRLKWVKVVLCPSLDLFTAKMVEDLLIVNTICFSLRLCVFARNLTFLPKTAQGRNG
jgi:hypothetical protein